MPDYTPIILQGNPAEQARQAAIAVAAAAALPAYETANDAKVDIYDDYPFGAATVAVSGIPTSAGSSRWITAPIGIAGPLVGLSVACELAGPGKILLVKPNAGTPANWDGVTSIPYTFAAGVNTLSQSDIETAASGQVDVTADMCVGFYSATAMFSDVTGASGSARVAPVDMTGKVNQVGASTTGFPVISILVRALTATPVNERVLALEADHAETAASLATTADTADRVAALSEPLLSALAGDFVDAGGVASVGYWGVDEDSWMGGFDIAASGSDVTVSDENVIYRLDVPLNLTDATLAKMSATVILRDGDSAALEASAVQAGDLVFGPTMYALADLGLTAGSSGFAEIPIPGGLGGAYAVGKRIYYKLEGYASDGTTRKTFRIGRSTSASGTFGQGLRGRFGNGNVNSNVASPNRNAGSVMVATIAAAGIADLQAQMDDVDPDIALDFLLPDKLWLTAGRPLPFAWDAMASVPIRRGVIDASIQSLKYMPSASTGTTVKAPLSQRGDGPLTIDPDTVGTSVIFTARKRSVTGGFVGKTIPASVTAWTKVASPVVLMLGDSLASQYRAPALSQELVARGMTPTFLGDLSATFVNSNYGGGFSTASEEGRGGKAMADFIYSRVYDAANVNTMKPCVGATAISYASYLALPATGNAGVDAKSNRNPFLVASAGAGSHNGFKWSLTQYLSYTGKATPTHVFISLGVNDLLQMDLATAQANVAAGIALMVSEIRAVSASAYICFYSDGLGIDASAEAIWSDHHALMQAQYTAVAALVTAGDTKLTYIPLGLHEDPNRHGLVTVGSTDAYGLQSLAYDSAAAGWLHPSDVNILNSISPMASFVAATS